MKPPKDIDVKDVNSKIIKPLEKILKLLGFRITERPDTVNIWQLIRGVRGILRQHGYKVEYCPKNED